MFHRNKCNFVDSREINAADMHILVKRKKGDVKKKVNQWFMGGRQLKYE